MLELKLLFSKNRVINLVLNSATVFFFFSETVNLLQTYVQCVVVEVKSFVLAAK